MQKDMARPFLRLVPAIVIATMLLAGCKHALPRAGMADGPPNAWFAQCDARPNYRQFVDALRRAVSSRDGARLRHLFSVDGRMRMNGIGGDRIDPDWNLDRPAAAAIWEELEEIVRLGCAARGDRLYLPFMAAPGDGAGEDQLIALTRIAVRTSPAPDAPIRTMIAPGAILLPLRGDAGWTHVATTNGVEGYVPDAAVRSPSSTALVLVLENGQWRIRWLGGNV